MQKRGIISDYLPWLLIAVAVLAIIVISMALMKSQGVSLIDKISDLFKFR